jgi:magnesium chelatase subunit D
LCAASLALGIASLRAPVLALRAARVLAALAGRSSVMEEDASEAARLVLAPRATMIPSAPDQEAAPPEDPAEPDAPPEDDMEQAAEPEHAQQDVSDSVLEAARAAIPAGLLAKLRIAEQGHARGLSTGRAGAPRRTMRGGRPIGVRRGGIRSGARLNVVATLLAAAPWQALRKRNLPPEIPRTRRIEVRHDDFRVTQFKLRDQVTTIFVVDASGSAALHRLAEAKGAVELLLADCYVRRDKVALVSFRGNSAEIVLPPTRSLARARKSLAGMPGGGSTSVAAGVRTALALADSVRRAGATPLLVFLSDARSNVCMDGSPGRAQAEAEAQLAARALASQALTALFIDTSPQPEPRARRLAEDMRATYLALPYADAAALSQAVRAAGAAPRA